MEQNPSRWEDCPLDSDVNVGILVEAIRILLVDSGLKVQRREIEQLYSHGRVVRHREFRIVRDPIRYMKDKKESNE